jgi:hypothetical protein
MVTPIMRTRNTTSGHTSTIFITTGASIWRQMVSRRHAAKLHFFKYSPSRGPKITGYYKPIVAEKD